MFWMINIVNYTEIFFKAFCIDFKLGKCLFHRKFNAKIIIIMINQLHSVSGLASAQSKSGL